MEEPTHSTNDAGALHADANSLAADRQAAARGVGLRLSLACPKCGSEGWTQWQNLSHGMHCRTCGCHFLVGKQGKLKALDSLPKVRFVCPRCLQTDEIPAMLAGREV